MTPNAPRRRLAWTRPSGLSLVISLLTMSGLAGPIAGAGANGKQISGSIVASRLP